MMPKPEILSRTPVLSIGTSRTTPAEAMTHHAYREVRTPTLLQY